MGFPNVKVVGSSKFSYLAIDYDISGAHAPQDVVGHGMVEVARTGIGGGAVLQSIGLASTETVATGLEILFFNEDSSPALAKNLPPNWSGGDENRLLCKVSVAAGDWVEIGPLLFASVNGIGAVLKPANGTQVHVVVITTGSPSYTGGSLSLNLGLLQD